jgi:hypothetical protein
VEGGEGWLAKQDLSWGGAREGLSVCLTRIECAWNGAGRLKLTRRLGDWLGDCVGLSRQRQDSFEVAWAVLDLGHGCSSSLARLGLGRLIVHEVDLLLDDSRSETKLELSFGSTVELLVDRGIAAI